MAQMHNNSSDTDDNMRGIHIHIGTIFTTVCASPDVRMHTIMKKSDRVAHNMYAYVYILCVYIYPLRVHSQSLVGQAIVT